MKHGAETLGRQVWELLERMVRERLARRPGGHLVESDLDRLELNLSVALDSTDGGSERFGRELVQSIDRLLDDAVQHAVAFRPGHAFCHRCAKAGCEHSAPPSGRHVFTGYGPTGLPRWEDFAQFCLERHHPEVDRLYEQPPAFLTVVQDKHELHGGLLQAYHHESYELLGQVAAGFFTVRARAEEGRGVLALTVQAAASRGPNGRRRFGLNVIGLTPGGESLDTLWDRHDELPWRKSVRWAQGALQTLGPAGDRLDQRVAGILNGLARRLARDRRARARRTRHAEQRHAAGGRPTPKAVEDVRAAADEAFMFDEQAGTLVVLGHRGRTHFFSPEGQLVSSVRYSKDAIARKVKLKRWRPATSEESSALRDRLRD